MLDSNLKKLKKKEKKKKKKKKFDKRDISVYEMIYCLNTIEAIRMYM